jgi:hypothetical protein
MLRRAHLPTLLFVALLVAVLSVLRTGTRDGATVAPDPYPAHRSAAPELVSPYVLAPFEDFLVSVERTLFTPTRRPPDPDAPPPQPAVPRKPPAPAVPPRLTLLATVREGERRVALVSTLAPVSSLELELGDSVDGWTVSAIELDRITLERGDARHELLLRPYDKAR